MAGPGTRGERAATLLLAASAAVAGIGVCGILVFLAILSLPALQGAADVFTWDWRPFHGHHGILTMLAGSLLLATSAVLLALPLALGITAFAHGLGPRSLARIVLGVAHAMTGIPTIVYAFVSAMLLIPLVRGTFVHGSGYSLLSAALVLSVLVLPTIVLVVHAHWQAMGQEVIRTCAALGIPRARAVLRVLLPLSWRGLVTAGVLGFARALGDTMIALLLSGNAAQVPASPLDGFRALTAHIALVIATDTQDAAYASIFAAGLILLLVAAARESHGAAADAARRTDGGLPCGASLTGWASPGRGLRAWASCSASGRCW